MAHISAKVQLTKLEHVITKTKQGNDVIIIPIKQNHLYMSEKGNVFLDMFMYENPDDSKGKEFGDYTINQSLSKEVNEAMKKGNEGKDKKDMKYAPTLGNGKFIGVQEAPANVQESFETADGGDDMPF